MFDFPASALSGDTAFQRCEADNGEIVLAAIFGALTLPLVSALPTEGDISTESIADPAPLKPVVA